MASKTFEQYRSDNVYKLVLTLTGTSNTEGNYSDVTYELILYALNSACAYHYNYGNKLVLMINGQALVSTENIGSVILNGISSKTLVSGTIRVPHNEDGTKTISVSAVFAQTQNTGHANYNISGEMVLDVIARASKPTLSASGVEFGKAVTITTNRSSSSFTHTLRYSFCTKKGTIATNVGASGTWTVPLSLMSEIPNSTKSWATILCDTYSNGTLIGTEQVTLNLTVPSDIVPTLTVAVEEAAAIPNGITGYIQGRSKLKVSGTGVGQYGATITSYAVTVEGTKYSGLPVTTNTISGSGTITVAVTATDSRGHTAIKGISVTVTAYSAPKLTGMSAYRCASADSTAADKDGAYICVKPRGSITALGNKNGKTCTVYYKKASAASYSSKALTMNDYTLDTEYVIFAAEAGSSYHIYVVLADSFSSTRNNGVQVIAASAFIHILSDRTGMGIGKMAEGPGVDVGMDAIFRKNVTMYYGSEGYDAAKLISHVLDHKTLNSSTYDLDTIGQGMFFCNFSVVQNSPSASGYGMVFSWKFDKVIVQLAIYMNSHKLAHRMYSNSQWYAWQIFT